MQHPAELSVHSYLRKSIDGKAGMSQEVIDKVADDIKEALHKQFNSEKRKFKVRMSNVGRPKCQLWLIRIILRKQSLYLHHLRLT